MVKLQLALDFVKIGDALAIAEKAAKHCDILEAGTPLIKAEGLNAVKTLKEKYPDKLIVADMKTMDTGFLEADIAYDAGADIVTVLGAADRETIKGVVDAARKHNKIMMVDSIGVEDIEGLVLKIDGIDIDYLVIHCGIDQQNAGKSPYTDLEKVINLDFKANVALVGGLNAESLEKLSLYPRVSLAMVGGAITKAENPEASAEKIRGVLDGICKENGS